MIIFIMILLCYYHLHYATIMNDYHYHCNRYHCRRSPLFPLSDVCPSSVHPRVTVALWRRPDQHLGRPADSVEQGRLIFHRDIALDERHLDMPIPDPRPWGAIPTRIHPHGRGWIPTRIQTSGRGSGMESPPPSVGIRDGHGQALLFQRVASMKD